MLTKFSDQYKDENKKFVKVEISKGNFALHMGYEVSYKSAVKKAKKLKNKQIKYPYRAPLKTLVTLRGNQKR